jgi:hypothetical protein
MVRKLERDEYSPETIFSIMHPEIKASLARSIRTPGYKKIKKPLSS